MLDGVNLIPYLRGEKASAPHQALYWRWNGQAAIRKGHWKYLTGGGREYLFDLQSDQQEKKNLFQQHRERAHRLHAELKAWSQTLQPPGLDSKISKAAERYFDWYLDGRGDIQTPNADK